MTHNRIKVFLADDDEDDREFFREAIQSLFPDCELNMVNDGESAINFLKSCTDLPDFVFLDINMPIKNGIECLKLLKGFRPAPAFPVIMLSTSAAEHAIQQSYDSGASLYIQKPSRFNDLVRYLRYCIEELDPKTSRQNFLLNKRMGTLIP